MRAGAQDSKELSGHYCTLSGFLSHLSRLYKGHSCLAMTRHYSNLADSDVRA
jgi:hypothetical protein